MSIKTGLKLAFIFTLVSCSYAESTGGKFISKGWDNFIKPDQTKAERAEDGSVGYSYDGKQYQVIAENGNWVAAKCPTGKTIKLDRDWAQRDINLEAFRSYIYQKCAVSSW
ncbi:hypothetical protein [Helicobacter sp.]|uniref:hypothetical protein n=1 Tax=Helicobacter sp. TaxID=218 RepID=UPI0019C8A84E|nr:hypothetical protein [Helicobacter sp.]MBD5164845.1 hypothetical protein [Helicobacter sp.]